jgi:hypothetical protein
MPVLRARPHRSILALAALAAALAGCNRAVDEPNAPPAAASATAVAPLLFDTPGGWTKLEAPSSGPKKGSYRIDKVGNDKEEAEMNVFFFGTGAKGDPAPLFKEWFSQFDGNVGATAAREQLEVKGFKVETVEVSGTYKIGLTPPTRGHKQAPVQMVKNGWRLYGAVVRTPDRGNWFFKITGPDETVQASKSAFRAMLETLH